MTDTGSFRKVVFLDTNVLHFIDLYLRRAREHDLFPVAGEEEAAYRHLDGLPKDKLRRSLTDGLNAVACLLREEARVEYSSIAELELMAGRARGRAVEKAAAEGIPDRMWTRFDETEVGDRLLGSDLTAIRNRIEELGPELTAAGLDTAVAGAERTRDAIELAKDVAEAVYMGFADSVIYAGALVAEADELLSADNYLTKAINRIKSEASLRQARERLETRVAAILSREPATVTLPSATKIPARKS